MSDESKPAANEVVRIPGMTGVLPPGSYDPTSVTITIGGVQMEGLAEISYRDGPEMDAVRAGSRGTVGSTRGRFVVEGSMELVGPGLDDLATVLGMTRDEPSIRVTPSSFGRDATRALVMSTADALGLDATVDVTTPDPPDGRALVTVDDSGGPLRNRELAAIREALAPYLPAGVVAVVRDAAQLRGMKERALAEQGDVLPAVTAAELRARMGLPEDWRRPLP